MARFILSTFGSQGNVSPFIRLGISLKQWGHDVILITHTHYADYFGETGLRIVGIGDRASHERMLEDGNQLNDPRMVVEFFGTHVIPYALREAEIACELVGCERSTVCITSEHPGLGLRIAATKLRAPLVTVHLYPASVATRDLTIALLENLRDQIGAVCSRIGIAPPKDLKSWWGLASAQVAAWPRWFYDVHLSPPGLIYAGFLWHSPRDTQLGAGTVPSDYSGNPSILATGGTGGFAGREFFDLINRAAPLLHDGVLLVANNAQPLPSPLSSDLVWVPKVDYLWDRICRASLVINHGGLGTVGQCVCAGIPQLILAAGGDRPLNGKIVQELGLGLFLPKRLWSPSAVAAACRELLNDSRIADRCRRVAKCKQPEMSVDVRTAVESLARGGLL